jgi:hypothetical protein
MLLITPKHSARSTSIRAGRSRALGGSRRYPRTRRERGRELPATPLHAIGDASTTSLYDWSSSLRADDGSSRPALFHESSCSAHHPKGTAYLNLQLCVCAA